MEIIYSRLTSAGVTLFTSLLLIMTTLSGTAAVVRDFGDDGMVADFPNQSLPEVDSVIVASEDIPPGMLISEISLRIMLTGPASSALRLQLRGGASEWAINLQVPAHGEWVEYHIQTSYSAGWSGVPDRDAAMFASDLLNATTVQLYARRAGLTGAQSVHVEALTVVGVVPPPSVDELQGDRDGDGMPDYWEVDNGLSFLAPEDADSDDDEDSMTNYAEFLAGTDPNDDSSALMIEQVTRGNGVSGANHTLTWQSALGRSYSVWRTTDLSLGFEEVAQAIPSGGEQTVFEDTSGGSGRTFYYKIKLSTEPVL